MDAGDSFKSEAGYTGLFDTFTKGRIEQQQVWVGKRLVPKLVQRLGTTSKSSDFRVLAVGSGNGVFDLMLLEELFKGARDLLHGRKIKWTVVEPNDVAIKAFRDKVDKISRFENVEFEWINKGFDQFVNENQASKLAFDFIHFVHILYYVDESCVLGVAYEQLLGKGGLLLCVVGSKGDIWVNLLDSFGDKIESLQKELHYPTNVTLCGICERKEWKFETFEGKLDLDISPIFVDGHPAGRALLQFFLHSKDDPKQVVGEELYSQLIEFFKSQTWEVDSEGEKKYFVNDNEGIVLVYK